MKGHTSMADKLTKGVHASPLRRSIRNRIESEDPEREYEWDRLPLRYLIGKSVDKHISDPKFRLESPDDEDALEIATRALVYRYVHYVQLDIYGAMKICESPIERTMLGAIVAVAVKEQIGVRFKSEEERDLKLLGIDSGTHPSRFSTATLVITPQVQIGEYRIDLLLELELIHVTFPPECKGPDPKTGREILIRPELREQTVVKKEIIVECDGHEFHEKTKIQAARDKKRDRVLQSKGYNVFRFTGSEIYNDAISCAYEVYESMIAAVDKQVPHEERSKEDIREQIEAIIIELFLLESDESIAPKVKARQKSDLERLLERVKREYEVS